MLAATLNSRRAHINALVQEALRALDHKPTLARLRPVALRHADSLARLQQLSVPEPEDRGPRLTVRIQLTRQLQAGALPHHSRLLQVDDKGGKNREEREFARTPRDRHLVRVLFFHAHEATRLDDDVAVCVEDLTGKVALELVGHLSDL